MTTSQIRSFNRVALMSVAMGVITLLALPVTQAAVKTWQGVGGSALFSGAGNWGTGGVPGIADTVSFTGSTATTCSVTGSPTVAAITVSGTGSPALSIATGQILTVTGDYTQTSNTPLFALSGGGTLEVTGAFNQSVGTFTQSAGTVLLDAIGAKNLVTHTASFFNLAINDGLLGYWKFDEAATPSVDSSGWGRNGVWTGAIGSSTTVPALNFTDSRSLTVAAGTNDAVTFPSPTLSAITIAAWVFSTSRTSTFPRIVDMLAFDLSVADGTVPIPNCFAWTAAVTGSLAYRTPPGSFLDNTLYHIAASFDAAGNAKMYINGVSQTIAVSGTLGTLPYVSNSGSGFIGNNTNSAGNRPWNGWIDDLRIYNRVLDDTEVYSLYIGNQPGTGSAVQSMSGAPTVSNDLILASGTLSVGSSNLTVGGSWNNYGGLFTAGTGTVTLNSTTGEVIRSAGRPFQNLTLSGAGATWALEDWLKIDGALAMTSGALSPGAYAVHVADLTRTSGTLTAGTGTVVIDTTSVPAGDGSGFGLTFNNLRVEAPNETGLVGHWRFDEGQGDTIRDASGTGNNGTLISTKWTGSLPLAIDFDNHAALSFNGTSAYAEVGTTLLPANNANQTISAWVNITNSSDHFIVTLWDASSSGTTLGVLGGAIKAWGWNTLVLASTTLPSLGFWHHIAYTFDGTTHKVYVDGGAPGVGTTTPNTHAVTRAQFGAFNNGSNVSPYSGLLDDVRIYSVALTLAQIQALAAGGYSGVGGGATVTMGANLTVNGTLAIDNGTLATGAFTINAAATDSTKTAMVNAGTLAIGSNRATFNGGLLVGEQGTITENIVGGAIALGAGEQLEYDNLSGAIVGFPTAAFDWNSFSFWREYITYSAYTGSGTAADTVLAFSADGGTKYAWSLPSSRGSLLGTPRWNTEGTAPIVHYVYLITTLGYVYKVQDSGSALTTVAGGTWPYRNGASATGTSPLANDSSNLYWSGNDGGGSPKIFSLTLGGALNTALTVTATVSAAPALAMINSIPYVFFAIAGRVYQETLTLGSQWTSTQPATAVNGRISFNGNTLYFPENNGSVWALTATSTAGPTTASGWPYQDRSGTRHLAACTGGAFACPPVSNIYVDIGQGRICFGDQDGHVYVLNSNGTPLTGFPWQPGSAADNFQAAPLSRNGVLLIGATNGNVYEIDENNGTTRALTRTYTLSAAASSISFNSAANGGSGAYTVGTADGKLFYLGVGNDPSGPI